MRIGALHSAEPVPSDTCPAQLDASVARFVAWRKRTRVSPPAQYATYGIVYDNPDTVPPEDFRFGIACVVPGPLASNADGIIEKRIPAGPCAVLQHRGSRERVGDSVYPLYRDWLPTSGEQLRDFPLFFGYHNFYPETPEHALLTTIYLPLAEREGG